MGRYAFSRFPLPVVCWKTLSGPCLVAHIQYDLFKSYKGYKNQVQWEVMDCWQCLKAYVSPYAYNYYVEDFS